MTDKRKVESNELAELRKRAESPLRQEDVELPDTPPEDVSDLVHELQTHRIELEMQNEELRRAQGELVESRNRYSDLYDLAPVGYVTINAEGLIVEANLTLARMLGVERRDLVQRNLATFIDQDDQDVFHRYRRTILESRQRVECRLRVVRRDVEPLWVEIDSILVEADDDNETRLRTVVSDITSRKRTEEQLDALSLQLIRAQDAEREYIAHELHDDFGQSLAVAKLAAHRLHARLSAEQSSHLSIADQICGQLDSSIEKMRRLYQSLDPNALQTLGLVGAIDELTVRFREGTEIACRVELDAPPPSLDEEQQLNLYRIIQEALTNAARHAAATEVEVALRVSDSRLRLDVRDNGCGIGPERATAPTSLGLAGMRMRAQQCGGSMAIRGKPGEGTVLTIELPIDPADS